MEPGTAAMVACPPVPLPCHIRHAQMMGPHCTWAQHRAGTLQSRAEMYSGVLKLKCSPKSFSLVPKGPSRGGGHEHQPCHHHEIVSSCATQHSNNCEIPRGVTDSFHCNVSGSKQGRRGEVTAQGELKSILQGCLQCKQEQAPTVSSRML